MPRIGRPVPPLASNQAKTPRMASSVEVSVVAFGSRLMVGSAVVEVDRGGLAADRGRVALGVVDAGDVLGVGRVDEQVAVALDVPGRAEAGAEGAVVDGRRARAVLAVVLVVADAEVEGEVVG